MKYYIIAGEASGDLHGSNLIKAILAKDTNAQISWCGGDRMQKAGGTLVRQYKEMSFLGCEDVITNLTTIFKSKNLCKVDIKSYNTEVL